MRNNLRKKERTRLLNGFFIIILAIFIFSLMAGAVLAQTNLGVDYGQNIGLSNRDPRDIVVSIIQVALGFLGIIAVILVIYAGFIWMMSGGDPAKVDQAKKILRNAAIGLIIILAAWGITAFIVKFFFEATINGPGGGSGGVNPGGGIPALGSGIIESHYPARNQRNVARNTVITVTFKEPIDPDTVCQGGDGSCDPGDTIIDESIRIYISDDGDSCPSPCPNNVVDVEAVSTDNRTFVFHPRAYLGSPSEKIWYTVALSDALKKANGDKAFPGAISGIGYSWKFEVGTVIDTTPPKIKSIIPQPAATEPRNVVIQINFDEAINPLAGTGSYNPGAGQFFDNIEVDNVTAGGIVAGNYLISNQYKTIEFLTEDFCGTNSCGDDVYCLPSLSELKTLVRAASLATAGQPTAVFPYDGIVDMADNSLDGNGDGSAEGPVAECDLAGLGATPICAAAGDSAFWTFTTSDTIDISAPLVVSINPGIGASGISPTAKPQAAFNKLLLSSSLNSTNIGLTPGPINYWIDKTNDNTLNQTTVIIGHDSFLPDTVYTPRFNQGIRDIYQNCYNPTGGNNLGQGINCTGAPSPGPYCCNGAWSASPCP